MKLLKIIIFILTLLQQSARLNQTCDFRIFIRRDARLVIIKFELTHVVTVGFIKMRFNAAYSCESDGGSGSRYVYE